MFRICPGVHGVELICKKGEYCHPRLGKCYSPKTECTDTDNTPFRGCVLQSCTSSDPTNPTSKVVFNPNACRCGNNICNKAGMICTEDSRCIASCGPRSSSYPTRMFTECTCTSDDGSITNICPYTKNKNVLCTSNGVCSSGASGHLKDIFIPTIYGFGGFVLLMCLIKIPYFMNRRSADRKNTREGTMVIIPVEQTVLSLSCLYCCSYKINHSDLIVNPHLIAHGLTAHEIGEKVRLVNQ